MTAKVKNILAVVLSITLLTFFVLLPSSHATETQTPSLLATVETVPDEVVLTFKESGVEASIAAKYGLTLDVNREVQAFRNDYHVNYPHIAKIPPGSDLDEIIWQLQQDPDVAYAEKHILIPIPLIIERREQGQMALVNDLSSHPQSTSSLRDELQWFLQKIEVPDGFSSQTLIAVIGSGVTPASDQLRQAIVPGGYDFVNHTDDYSDADGHETSVAGEISGQYGMGAVPILPLKVFKGRNAQGQPLMDLLAAANAIRYAVDQGARVINMSFGGNGATSQYFLEAIRYAGAHGVLCVAAAGNSHSNNDLLPFSPASSALTEWNLIAVAASGRQDQLADFSNFGVKTTQVVAPGEGIFAEQSTETNYVFVGGTSCAAPIVSTLLAKAIDQTIGSDLVEQAHRAKEAVLVTGDPIESLVGKVGAASRVNTARLIRNERNPEPQFTFPSEIHALKKQETVFAINVTNQSLGMLSYLWEFGDGKTAQTEIPEVMHKYKPVGSYTLTCSVKYFTGKVFTYTSTVTVTKR